MSTVREKAVEAAAEVGALLEGREGSYGDYGTNMRRLAELKGQIGRIQCPVLRESAFHICGKLARIANGEEEHEDSWRDIAGYALLALGWIRTEQDDG